jgi:acyl-coenzyme A thioesterase PaaI-like protein
VTTDYDALKEGLQAAIPFNNHLGIKYLDIGPATGVTELPADERLFNHVGSQHAAGMFGAGEAASGGALMAAFADRMGSIMPLAEGADIKYKKLAQGPIKATATFGADRDAVFAELEEAGRVRFPVEVALTDEQDQLVAEMTVRWYVKKIG